MFLIIEGVTMKRVAVLAVSMAFLLCLGGCSGNNVSDSDSSSYVSEQSEENESFSSEQSEGSGSYVDEQPDETASDSSQYEYIETDDRKRKSIVSNASDYETGDSSSSNDSESSFTYVELNDIVYYGLGNTFSNILDFSGRSSEPSYVGFGNQGMRGTYYTHFDNMDNNRHLLFSTNYDTYFNSSDYCYGANGWFSRVFDYERNPGSCTVSDLASVLNAKSTYAVSSWPEEYYVPSNLDSSGLYAIEADLSTTSGVQSCVILLEADSDAQHISDDTWTIVLVQ